MLNRFRDIFLLEIVVFISGAVVMIYEIVGSRILAPYIGTSTYIWTSLIGVILGSLSLGYWLGGRMADRKPELRILAFVLFIAAGLMTVTMLIQEFVLSALATATLRLEIKAVIAALMLFAPASIFFGFVAPYAIRLKMLSVEEAGKTVGRLYALSTVGSIFGTFAAGFFLLPFVGSVRTLYLLIGSLFALSVVVAPFKLTPKRLYVLLLFPAAIGFNEFYAYTLRKNYDLHDVDTYYNRARVFRSVDKKTEKPIMALSFSPLSLQSAMFIDSDELVLNYSKFYHLLRHFKPDFQKTLIIGGAGYSFPKEYLRKYPGKQIDAVEIDPQMTELARKYFRLTDDPNLKIFHEDGRIFLNQSQANTYDVLLLDAFGSIYSVPFQMTTREAVAQMKRVTTANGVVILNLISALEGEGSCFLQSEYKTFAETFPHVFVFKVNSDEPDDKTQNLIMVAAKSENISFETNDAEISSLLANRYKNALNLTVPVLTDELAPVEYYSSLAQKHSD